MSTALQVVPQLTNDQINLIKRTYARGATDDELKLFVHQCNRTGLDPLSRQIYFQKYKSKNGDSQMTIITGIDGYRIIAARSDRYAGSDDAIFDNEDAPKKATMTVYKIVGGAKCAFTASARWNEYFPGDSKGHIWRKMPCTMLAKCAEALALRKAFPNELSGVYVKEEMDQKHGELIDANFKKIDQTAPKIFENVRKDPAPDIYIGNNEDQKKLSEYLVKTHVDVELHDAIHKCLMGKDKRELHAVIKAVTDEMIFNQTSEVAAEHGNI